MCEFRKREASGLNETARVTYAVDGKSALECSQMRAPEAKKQTRDTEDLIGNKRKFQEAAEVMDESDYDSDYDAIKDNIRSNKRQR